MNYRSPLEAYHGHLSAGKIQEDEAQYKAVSMLEDLYRLLSAGHEQSGFLASVMKVFSKPDMPQGLYFWGGVGRGKTYLMDLFYDALPFESKLRTHFHRFMRKVHHELKQLDDQKDPLEIVAEKFARQYRVICFDEFFVVDITDAMILANLLEGLFKRGVCLVATSNIVPSGLYKDGLQRARFLPAIALLEKHCQVVNVDGGTDYRLRTLKQSKLYYSPAGEASEQALEACFEHLSPVDEHIERDVELEIEGRSIKAKRRSDDVVWFDFLELCDGPRSQNDYIELAREFQSVLVSGVPCFTETNDDQARRFIYLVDEFYDRNVKLILSAEVPFMSLYKSGRLSFEFQRTQSRLQEMQSETYLSAPHKG